MQDGNRNFEHGRVNQKLRTRQALLDAAAQLPGEHRSPSLSEIAEKALVSKATAYRYFPSVEALIQEAFFQREFPKAEDLFAEGNQDLVERVRLVEREVHELMFNNELAIRVVMRNLLDAWLASDPEERASRPGRRLALLDAALEPFAGRLGPERLRKLRHGLALTIGTEAILATRDVCGLEVDEAREVTSWASMALARQALAEAELERTLDPV